MFEINKFLLEGSYVVVVVVFLKVRILCLFFFCEFVTVVEICMVILKE